MSEGEEVRRAYDGPDIDHDQLIGRAAQHNREDAERASSAAETRGDIGMFIEATGLNKKAYSWLRMILKAGDKSQDKAMDIIRSLEMALPMVKAHVGGQGTSEMELSEPVEEDDLPNTYTDHDPSDEEAEFNAEVDEAVTPIDFRRAAE